MTFSSALTSTVVAAVLLAAATSAPAIADDTHETVALAFDQPIPNISGKSLVAVTVDYAPSAASPAHAHSKSAFIFAYVLSGAIDSQVDDGPVKTYRAGESFQEAPGARHRISRNASATEPAKLLAVFVVDTNDKPLTTPLK